MTEIDKTRKTLEDFNGVFDNLKMCVSSYIKGNFNAYRDIATNLRVLLCDKDKSIMSKLFDRKCLFHPLNDKKIIKVKCDKGINFGFVANYGKRFLYIQNMFDKYQDPIPINDWLKQQLIDGNPDYNIRNFIRSVSDKIGAHSDDNYNDILKLGKSVQFKLQQLSSKVPYTAVIIFSIGLYVLERMAAAACVWNIKWAGVYFEKGDYKKAMELLLEGLKYDNKNKDAHSNIGLVYLEMNKLDKAEDAFIKAIEYGFLEYNVFYNLACLYSKKMDKIKTIQYLKKAIEINPKCIIDAGKDKDFSNYQNDKEFTELLSS
jgi:tetratricopeptide (TPR) repeat protein